jgi:hypothetical protein
MEVPGDTSNDTCMFEKSEELTTWYTNRTRSICSKYKMYLQHHWTQPSSSETIIQVS